VRLVILIAVVVLFVTVVLPLLRRHPVATRRAPGGPRDELVKDPVCHTYIVRSRAVTAGGRADSPYFCSAECARRYSG
jgi:hypothetical protein